MRDLMDSLEKSCGETLELDVFAEWEQSILYREVMRRLGSIPAQSYKAEDGVVHAGSRVAARYREAGREGARVLGALAGSGARGGRRGVVDEFAGVDGED